MLFYSDTVMHLATAEAIVDKSCTTMQEMFEKLAILYVKCFEDMDGRAPGPMTIKNIDRLKKGYKWYTIPYNRAGGGCGGSMRAM